MKEVSVSMWEVTPEEALRLPKGTQLIEYNPKTKRLSVKQADFCLYDYTCVYLLTQDPAEISSVADGNKNRNGEKPRR